MTTPALTPAKKTFALPTAALTDAIAAEWQGKKQFNAGKMPLTALAYTAIDRVEAQPENALDILLAYVDTDTLCYRSSSSDALKKLQHEQWDPVLVWAGGKFNAIWQTTSGVMPLEQPEALHAAIRNYLSSQDSMRLTACTVLASLYSSLVLAIAVMEKRLNADGAFELSRLEEEYQNEQWGVDPMAAQRVERFKEEVAQASRFLRLLEQA